MNILKKLFGGKNPAAADMPPTPPSVSPPPQPLRITEISPTDLQARLNNGAGNLVVVDMRAGWEYQAGHIPGAIHMFIQEIPARFHELPRDTDVVFQCWHGNTSQDASAFLIQKGWDAARVASLRGGMAGWVQTHGPDSLAK